MTHVLDTTDPAVPETDGCALAPALIPLDWSEGLAKAAAIPQDKLRGPAKFAGYVEGWASIGTRDRQGEIIEPNGLDVSMLLSDGWFNDNHDKSTEGAVGYPVLAELRKHPKYGTALWTEGPVLDTAKGRGLIELGKSLLGTDRALGFSVEGPPPVRHPTDPRRITKAYVWNIAITNRPVHQDARIELVKSLESAPGLLAALHAFTASHPHEARLIWAHVEKSMEAAAPVGNTATGGGAIQGESLATDGTKKREDKPKGKSRLLTIEEAKAFVTDWCKANGVPVHAAAAALARITGGA